MVALNLPLHWPLPLMVVMVDEVVVVVSGSRTIRTRRIHSGSPERLRRWRCTSLGMSMPIVTVPMLGGHVVVVVV